MMNIHVHVFLEERDREAGRQTDRHRQRVKETEID